MHGLYIFPDSFNGLDTSNEEAYNTRYNQLTAKFQQLYDAGESVSLIF